MLLIAVSAFQTGVCFPLVILFLRLFYFSGCFISLFILLSCLFCFPGYFVSGYFIFLFILFLVILFLYLFHFSGFPSSADEEVRRRQSLPAAPAFLPTWQCLSGTPPTLPASLLLRLVGQSWNLSRLFALVNGSMSPRRDPASDLWFHFLARIDDGRRQTDSGANRAAN